SVLQSLIRDVNREMEGYRLFAVVPRLVHFIDDLTNWYIRQNRSRFWKSQDRRDQAAAFHTLHEVLTTFARVLAPFMPFLTETVHQRLVVSVDPAAPRSVHFCDYPSANEALIDAELEQNVAIARSVVALGRRLREDHRIKVRQPLGKLTVVHRDPALRARVRAQEAVILGELNIKALDLEADERRFAEVSVKPNFASLKKKPGVGQKMGTLKPFIETLHLSDEGRGKIAQLERGESFLAHDIEITPSDVLFHRKATDNAAVATDGDLTVVLDTTLTPELVAEGHAREVRSEERRVGK